MVVPWEFPWPFLWMGSFRLVITRIAQPERNENPAQTFTPDKAKREQDM
jgi:hypothetical protein